MQTVISIPENATNGDILQLMFPKAKCEVRKYVVMFYFGGLGRELSIEWWNEPYDCNQSIID